VAEKEEAATPSSSLTCFKDHVSVELGTQTLDKTTRILEVLLESLHECEVAVVGDHDLLLYLNHSLLLSLKWIDSVFLILHLFLDGPIVDSLDLDLLELDRQVVGCGIAWVCQDYLADLALGLLTTSLAGLIVQQEREVRQTL